MRRALTFFAILFVLAVIVRAGAAAGPGQQQQPQPPQFRSGIIVVPIDVRVIDNKTGKAVPDLKAEDFTLFEDNVPQKIQLFEKHTLTAADTPAAAQKLQIRQSAFGVAEQHNRIFLFVLGRGKLQEPSKALDALIRFVRQNLLPQDQAAVFAYDRATDFTTDHESLAKLIERFKQVHYDIDMDVRLQADTPGGALYGSRALPKKTQQKIDALFQGAGTLASQEIGKAETPATKRLEADTRKTSDDLQRAEMNRVSVEMGKNAGPGAAPGGLGSWTSLDEITNDMFAGITFDDYMANTAQTLMDLSNCYAGIEYLRHLEGEKHMVFVTERGMYLPRVEDDEALARAANDARVAIDTFQTGGLIGQNGGQVQNNWNETFAFKALRNIAELTGGVSSIAEKGDIAVDRIDDASKTDYILGYYPSMARMDGKYRKIDVKVKRPDSMVVYRHGYYARRDVGSFNRRDFITRDRLAAAAGFSREIKDIKVSIDAKLQRQQDGTTQLIVQAKIDPSKLGLTVEDGVHKGAIDILLVGASEKGEIMAQNYQRAAIELKEEMWQKIAKDGIPYGVRVEVNPGVRQVRLIVYDYKADLVGRGDARVF